MEQYISKSALVAEIQKRRNKHFNSGGSPSSEYCHEDEEILGIIDALKVKTDEDNSLGKFKSLQHISGDLHQTLEDWGYAPNLYFFDGVWNVSWISCEEGDSIKDFEGNTPEEAINKAYNWFHSKFSNA